MDISDVAPADASDMSECDGDKVVTMMDVLQEQKEIEEDVNAVLGASDDKNCTYPKGYIKRQALYACLTCCSEAKTDPEKRAGVCLACSLNCHENHDLIELYTKRNFCCDCGNPKFSSSCQFTPNKTSLNENNKYNQNFSGLYCVCNRPYPDPDRSMDDEMIPCIICEDWLHASHLEATVPTSDQYSEMICKGCMEKNEFIHDYSEFAVHSNDNDVDIMNTKDSTMNGDSVASDVKVNGVNDDDKEQEQPNKEVAASSDEKQNAEENMDSKTSESTENKEDNSEKPADAASAVESKESRNETEEQKESIAEAVSEDQQMKEDSALPKNDSVSEKVEKVIENTQDAESDKAIEAIDKFLEESEPAKDAPQAATEQSKEDEKTGTEEKETEEKMQDGLENTEAKTNGDKEEISQESSETKANGVEEPKNEQKRKLSDVEEEEIAKKPKLDETSICKRPKGVTKVHKGATFWPSNFRQKLCTCNECISMYKDLSVLFLTEVDDTVTAYEDLGRENGTTQYENGMQALSSLDRIQQINALTEYNNMRDKLLDFLKNFKDRKEVVKEEDIKAFFAGMKPKREPDGVYFCR